MKKSIFTRLLGGVFAISGIGVLFYIAYPIVSYELVSSRFNTYLSPVPEKYVKAEVDYTKASTWFEDEGVSFDESGVDYYTVSIPRLKITDATVKIGGENLEDSLIQYPGTALPGKRGNTVIFGHSILPQFFNPADYLSIFSTLPTLDRGDEIFVQYDGIRYSYIIEDMFEVKPTDLQILEQDTSNSYLQLVTCTPPGHPLRPNRLIVRAKISPLASATYDNTLH
ncbi:hypothetical protein A2801_00670 [Candidatus Woesebacteria bacterium RIFCSPHIGHO2_01_FULL_41_10]|uniref:Sortase n=1 Tax=Candidatus Woesebacteria bacterium RIFCSPHIGHO2_01_FULL_41_10 TaxID=1802500 RepID=A0A1F7YMX2_9BACT|nr:MAG: hypothetical protein A2801_00670 [Candidatus Woesebacteria bacterium RIFCSPHIGHO2_01_FULL_41_10]